ncbi:dihydrofolate reductase family protein [Chryseobacterium pennipullorum]|uniref:Deaminase n=1 Tax=Chryseobacterium pennipullorum TaxID=2258963 RepID=A0A3D9B2L1_9FLAO|nr:dihydrofolate reductase family protein [Chryseobacterium pennipullorum]REC47466.1 deaminase [Chryseobacterium pennipullorum]
MNRNSKPYIICHMASTVNGRIISVNWGNAEQRNKYSTLYEHCHNSFESQAWMVGRATLEKDFTKGSPPELIHPETPIGREAFVGDSNATSFVIGVDNKGKLGWKSNEIDGDHIILILTEDISDSHLHYLRRVGISYVFAGKNEVNFKVALEQIGSLFPIQTIMLEGGGHIKGSLLNEGLIDELSLLLLPVVDGTGGAPTTFEVSKYLSKTPTQSLKLIDTVKLIENVLWLKYSFIANQI